MTLTKYGHTWWMVMVNSRQSMVNGHWSMVKSLGYLAQALDRTMHKMLKGTCTAGHLYAAPHVPCMASRIVCIAGFRPQCYDGAVRDARPRQGAYDSDSGVLPQCNARDAP